MADSNIIQQALAKLQTEQQMSQAPIEPIPLPEPAESQALVQQPIIAAPTLEPMQSPAPAGFAPAQQQVLPGAASPEQPDVFSQIASEEQQKLQQAQQQEQAQRQMEQLQTLNTEKQLIMEKMRSDAASGIPAKGLQEKYGNRLQELNSSINTLQNQGIKLPESTVAPAAPAILTAEDFKKATEPSIEEQQQANLQAQIPQIKLARAQANALDEVEKLRQEAADAQARREQELQTKYAELDNRVRVRSLNEIFSKGSFGDKLLAGLSIALGAASQALTGAKTNPVLDFMDKQVEQQAQRDKLTLEEKQMLQKQVYEAAAAETRRLENATNNAYRKDALKLQEQQINAQIAKIEAEIQEKLQKKQGSDAYSGRALTPDEELMARSDKDLAARLLISGNGKAHLGLSPERASAHANYAREVMPALDNLKKYRTLLESGTEFSLIDRGIAKSLETAIVGALRLPFTGPGVLQQKEKEDLLDAIGRFGLTNLDPVSQAKARTVYNSVLTSLQHSFSQAGGKGPAYEDVVMRKYRDENGKEVAAPEDKIEALIRQRKPNLSDKQVKQVLTALPEL